MKTITTLLAMTVSLCVGAFADEPWSEYKGKGVDEALRTGDLYKVYEHLPFKMLPLTKEERKTEIRMKRIQITRDPANNPVIATWDSRDGTLSVSINNLMPNVIGDGMMFYVTRKDGKGMPLQKFMLHRHEGKWRYQKFNTKEK